MVFDSLLFLLVFLPLFLIAWALSGNHWKNVVLIFFSLLFYAWGDAILAVIMLLAASITFGCGRLIGTGYKKAGLFIAVITNLSLLGYFKYAVFLVSVIRDLTGWPDAGFGNGFGLSATLFPVGISFYTFRAISYTVDASRGKISPSRDFSSFITWFTLFPVITAGPILRYDNNVTQWFQQPFASENLVAGARRVIAGLVKKVIIAGTLAPVAKMAFDTNPADLSAFMAWAGILAFSLQIYFDFSGYTDIALGLGKMTGLNLPENFNHPYISRNIHDFWRRWHITLSSWLRDYLFLPVAYLLSRNLPRNSYLGVKTDHILYALATMLTFLLCGLWHGAAITFIAWGAYYALFLILEQLFLRRMLKKSWKPIQHLYTLLVIIAGWVLFKSDSLAHAANYMGALLSVSKGNEHITSYFHLLFINYETLLVFGIAILLSTPALLNTKDYFDRIVIKRRIPASLLSAFALLLHLALFVMILSYLTIGNYSPFLYTRF